MAPAVPFSPQEPKGSRSACALRCLASGKVCTLGCLLGLRFVGTSYTDCIRNCRGSIHQSSAQEVCVVPPAPTCSHLLHAPCNSCAEIANHDEDASTSLFVLGIYQVNPGGYRVSFAFGCLPNQPSSTTPVSFRQPGTPGTPFSFWTEKSM